MNILIKNIKKNIDILIKAFIREHLDNDNLKKRKNKKRREEKKLKRKENKIKMN